MAVWLAAKTKRQEVMYGACWVCCTVVGYCAKRHVMTRVGLGAGLMAIRMTNVVVLVKALFHGFRGICERWPKGYPGVCGNAGHRVVHVGPIFGSGCLDG